MRDRARTDVRLVVLAAVLASALGLGMVALVALMVRIAGTTHDELLVPVLLVLALAPAAAAMLTVVSIVRMLRGSARAAARLRAVVIVLTLLVLAAAAFTLRNAIVGGEEPTFLLQFTALTVGVVLPLVGLTWLLSRCARRPAAVIGRGAGAG